MLNDAYIGPYLRCKVEKLDCGDDFRPFGELERLFLAEPQCPEWLIENHNIFILDCNYKIDPYNIPLLDIIGYS